MITKRTTIRIAFRAVSVASWPNANAGAVLVKEVLCVQPGLQSSGLSEAPLDLFILMKSLLVPPSVSSCQGEEGIDSEV